MRGKQMSFGADIMNAESGQELHGAFTNIDGAKDINFPDLSQIDEPTATKKGATSKFGHVHGHGFEASFFELARHPDQPMNFILNDSQWAFIYEFYPQFTHAPFELMGKIYEQESFNESIEASDLRS